MNTLSHFITITLLLWSIVVQAYTTTIPQYSSDSALYNNSHSVNELNTECNDVPKIDEKALVINLPSQQRWYVPAQGSPYQLEIRTSEQFFPCFKKVITLDTQTGELTPIVAQERDSTQHKINDPQWLLGIGSESRAVEEISIYSKTLQKLEEAIKANDPQQTLKLWPWQVPYSGVSKDLLAWLAELEPDALVLLKADSYQGLSTLAELSPNPSATTQAASFSGGSNQLLSATHSTNWTDRYVFNINNQIWVDDRQVPLTTLFGTRSLYFHVHWREENLFQINTPLENTEQLSLPLWFRPNSPLKSQITLILQETNALKAPLQLIDLNTQADQLIFKVRQKSVKPTILYPDETTLNWTTLCPIKKEPAQTWLNYLMKGAQLLCPYFDSQNKIKIELIGDGIRIDTRQLLLFFDFTLDDFHTVPKDWRIVGPLNHLQSNNQGVWTILASDLSLNQCSLKFEPISADAKLAFQATTTTIPNEICQRLYKQSYSQKQLGLKAWPTGQQEQSAHSFQIQVKPTPRLLQTHLPQDSLWRKMRWQLNQKENCQIDGRGYFDCESGNHLRFLDLLGGQITLQGFNETLSIAKKLVNNQALFAIYCGDWPRLFPLTQRNIIKGTPNKPYAVLDRQTNMTRRFNPIPGYQQQFWSLTGYAVKAEEIERFDKGGDQLFTHGIPVSHPQNLPTACQKYTYYQLATSDNKPLGSDCIIAPPPQSDSVHINWVFVNTQGEWRGIWDYHARELANPLAEFLHSVKQEMTFHIWFLDVNNTRQITLEEYSNTTVNSETDERKIFNRLIQPIQNRRGQFKYANFSQQVPQVLSALAEQQQWQKGGHYLTLLFAHRLSIAQLERQINRLPLQTQSLVILSRRLPKQSQRKAWAKQGIEFIRLTSNSYWYDKLVKRLKAWHTQD